MKRRLWMIPAALLFLFLYFLADPGYHSVEKRIYSQYAASLVEDFDLNVVNQIPAREAWLLTRTLNYPDVHSNGTAVTWAPFFGTAKLMAGADDPAPLERSAQTIANVFWGLMSAILIWLLLRRFYSFEVARLTGILLLLATPFVWHLVYQPENADISSLFWAVLLLHLFCERDRFKPVSFAFLFGLALFAGFAVKFDLIFYGLLFPYWLWTDARGRAKRTLAFAAGSALLAIPVLFNESLKAGFLDDAYFDTATRGVYILFENLFAPSGIFYAQPFWALLFAVAVALGIRKRAPLFYWVVLTIPLIELAIESFTYNQNETVAARHWVNDLGLFALVLGQILTWLKGRARNAFVAGAVLLGFVSVATTLAYRIDFDAYFFTGAWWPALLHANASDFSFLLTAHALEDKLRLWPLLWAATAVPLWTLAKIQEEKLSARFFSGFFAALAVGYGVATVGNWANNAKSPEKVPDRVKNAVLGAGPHINSFFENAGCLQRAVEYYDRRGEHGKALDRRHLLEDYVRKAANEIVSDPVGFKATLVPGRDRYVPLELWDEN